VLEEMQPSHEAHRHIRPSVLGIPPRRGRGCRRLDAAFAMQVPVAVSVHLDPERCNNRGPQSNILCQGPPEFPRV
jgi:hypothetical protein